MKNKLQKSAKAGSHKCKVPSDVSPSTSLPPLVEGQLRCFLRVTISRVLWTIHKPPPSTFIRLRWWGESSNGTHFIPRDGSQLSQKTIKTVARYPIRCSPKQFTSYLTDMGCLVVEVLSKPDHLPLARAQVPGISRLSLSQPIGGFYTLFSPTSEKLGEVQVSLNLEPLIEAYDISTSCPATQVINEERKLAAGSVVPHLSAGSRKSAGSSGGNTPRGKDDFYFQRDKNETLLNPVPTSDKFHISRTVENSSVEESNHGSASSDIISVILERGKKLRDAMAESSLKCEPDFTLPVKDSPLPLLTDSVSSPGNPFPSSTATFLQEILHVGSHLKLSDDVLAAESGLEYPADMDKRAVDLLLGSFSTSPPPLMDLLSSSPECLSCHGSECSDSELNHPLHDQSLLENLFYTTPNCNPDEDEKKATSTTQSSKNNPESPNSEHPFQQSAGSSNVVHSFLCEERLTSLSLIRAARVTIDSLTVPSTNSPKNMSQGKPLRPLPGKKCTYFVEYVFPTTYSSNRGKAGDGEVVRAVSAKVTSGVVNFHHVSVFPVHLRTDTIKQWCQTDLNFKVYIRKNDQKKPVAVGQAVHPLRSLMQSKELTQSVVLTVQSLEDEGPTQEIGPLKVLIELQPQVKSFYSEKKLTRRDTSPSKASKIPRREIHSSPKHGTSNREVDVDDVWVNQKPSEEIFNHLETQTPPLRVSQRVEEKPEVLLHALLMIPDGKNFSCGHLQPPNIYLNCKLFWCDETARSVVSWGQKNPRFNFVQVTPVALTDKLLERMKNNVMVIEVWQKIGSSQKDQLYGLAKLPLHQFYMSFRDPKITQLLLQAQYPVLGVDCYMPVIDVFSGCPRGDLRAVLAAGRWEQIMAFQQSRSEEYGSFPHLTRSVHMLDYQAQTKVRTAPVKIMREHVFVIRVERISGLAPLQSTVWGEADCYVLYMFPCQEVNAASNVDLSLIECSVELKPFRTATSLCIPDPVFGHTETHVLLAPEGVPVQRLLLSSLSTQGLSNGGGLQFEVWCRYYYPNVRDQLVARGLLPLSKLCAMATMQRQQHKEAQMFSLPLFPRTDGLTGFQAQPSGLLDVCIQYKHRPVRPEGQAGKGAASRVVTIVVQVHRACGLKAAARFISEQDVKFSSLLEIGVNPFVTVELSFLPETERRCTRTASRTFCPEFDHHMEVSCDLLLHMRSGETCSLAEQLEQASAVFTVWNRHSEKVNVLGPKDVLLGTVKVPMADLIHKRTGISGWFALYAMCESIPSQHRHIVVGGLEISISFAHHSDRERVTKAALGLGWEMPNSSDELADDEEEHWQEDMRKLSLSISVPKSWLPAHFLLEPGLMEIQRSTYCYFRFKFFDLEAFCSRLKHPTVGDGSDDYQATVSFEDGKTVELRMNRPLLWYLREEKLEVQMWVTFTKNRTERPSDSDKLLGSAFVDLSSLSKRRIHKTTISGVYPLFMRSSADLQGAAVRVHITLTAGSVSECMPAKHSTLVDSESQGDILVQDTKTEELILPQVTPNKPQRQQSKSPEAHPHVASNPSGEMGVDGSFPVTVLIDRAMHLNLKGCPLADRSEGAPCCCVSYVTADSAEPVSTSIVANSDCPVWNHQHECRLSNELLVDPQQFLVFKVWHKGEVEHVLGFVFVDLSPLLCGFTAVCGWYNISDLSGQCHGQIKVSVTPLRGVHSLIVQRQTVTEDAEKNSADLLQAAPLNYQTTAVYSSFPSHISRFPEQKISSPKPTHGMFSEMSCENDRHSEHVDKVRLYHQSLQEQTTSRPVSDASISDNSPSSSFLISTLRRKLGELDNIQRYFNRKLSTPVFPSVLDCHTQTQEQLNFESNPSQLILESNELVGEVKNIFSGLRGQNFEVIPTTTSPDTRPPICPESCPIRRVDDRLESASPLPSLPTEMSDDLTDSESDEGQNTLHAKEDGLNETRLRLDADTYEDEEEEFEEIVLQPRALNEVTSITNRTSPWTSVLSDPDAVCEESTEDSHQSEEDEGKRQVENPETHDLNQEDISHDESPISAGSVGDASDKESEQDETIQSVNQMDPGDIINRLGESPSPSQQANADHHDGSSPEHKTERRIQPSLPVDVPNFFLPSHQLEASLRAIRLAPSFSQALDSSSQKSAWRGLRSRPDMSPTSLKKETERIAQIFSAQFDKIS